MYTAFSKNVNHEIRCTVENLRMLFKVRGCVDEALEFDDTLDAIEAPKLELDCGEDVECCEAGEFVAILGRKLPAELVPYWGALPVSFKVVVA